MSTLLKRIRDAVAKVAFAAARRRRLHAIQANMEALQAETSQALYQAGFVAYELFRSGQVTEESLREACRRVQVLQEQTAELEEYRARVRREGYGEETPYHRLCPNGHGPVLPPHHFCETCGAAAVETPPPAEGARFCQHCGRSLGPQAHFCPGCGSPIRAPEAHATPALCWHCAAPLLPDATFCSACGTAVVGDEDAVQETASPLPSSAAPDPIAPAGLVAGAGVPGEEEVAIPTPAGEVSAVEEVALEEEAAGEGAATPAAEKTVIEEPVAPEPGAETVLEEPAPQTTLLEEPAAWEEAAGEAPETLLEAPPPQVPEQKEGEKKAEEEE